MQFFPTSEGYVKHTAGRFNYVYNYTDHLGNVRLSYGFDTKDQELKVMEEHNYYPFGLKHNNYNMLEKDYMQIMSVIGIEEPGFKDGGAYDYKYNGKELQDELGLNLYDYGAMLYDPATGRRNNIDPKAETSRRWSPYSYALNNPVYFIDPDGMEATDWYRNNKTGGVKWVDGSAKINGYTNLGYSVSDQSYGKNKTDHLIMDGDTKQITVNGVVIGDYSKTSASKGGNGIAFSDGGNNQDSGSLDKGGRGVEWVDFKGVLDLAVTLLSLPFRSVTPNDKGTNGGKPTVEDKVEDGVNSIDNSAGATKAVVEEKSAKPKKADSINYETYVNAKKIKTERKKNE